MINKSFKKASNHWKSVLESDKRACANNAEESFTSQNLGSCDLWQTANSVLRKYESAIPFLFNRPEVLPSASDKANILVETFLITLVLTIRVHLYLLSHEEITWNCMIALYSRSSNDMGDWNKRRHWKKINKWAAESGSWIKWGSWKNIGNSTLSFAFYSSSWKLTSDITNIKNSRAFPKIIQKVITDLDSSTAFYPLFIPEVVLKKCESELSNILADHFVYLLFSFYTLMILLMT